MNRNDSANILAGIFQNEDSQAKAPTNLHLTTGEVKEKSEDGKALVEMDGMVFSGSNEQYVEMDTIGGLEEGDTAAILLSGESGRAMTPFVLGSAGTADRIRNTAENAMTVGNENLSPFLSHDLTDRGTDASGAYWLNGSAVVMALDSATQLGNGWARFQGSYYQMALRVNQSQINVTAGATYTLLVELRNINAAPNGNKLLMVDSDPSYQLYGDGVQHDYTEGEYRIALTGSSNITQSMRLWLCNDNTAAYDFEMRVSIYEGDYHGPYKSVVADKESLSAAATLAQSAFDVANATGQHVWTDDDGLHITEITQDEWDEQHTGANQLMNSNGTLIRDGDINRTASTHSGYAIYDGGGNEAENIAAMFSSSMARIGSTTGSRTVLQADGAYFYDSAGAQAAAIKSGAVIEQGRSAAFVLTCENGVAEHLFPVKPVTVEEQGETYFVAPVLLTIACEAGRSRILIPYYGTYDGTWVTATLTEQTGGMKLVLTEKTPSDNPYEMLVNARYVGLFPTPSYEFGVNTSASANGAMALGVGTIASIERQLAIGAYNREYDGPFVIGNGGSDEQRINIFTVDWSGNIWANGKATLAKAIQAASAKITGALSFGGNLTVGSETFTTQQVIDVLTKALPVQLFKGTYSETYNKSVTLSESVDNFSRICIEWRTSDGANGSTMLDMDVATVTDAATGRTGRVAAAVAINNNVGATSAYIKSKLFFVSGTTISNWTRTISSSTVYQRSEATVKNNAATTITNNELIGITKVLGWR